MNKEYIKILQMIVVISILYLLYNQYNKPIIEGFSQEEKQVLFDDFMENHYRTIFPDGGRNSGGPMFYHYFLNNMTLDKGHFLVYNQFYCGVSGSIVSPSRSNITNHIVLEDLSGNEWFGKYYRCCVPCPCDLMRYAKVEPHTVQLSDGPYPHYVITIDDPCINPDGIPDQVTAYQCSNGITQNGERTSSGRLIVAVLFGHHEMDELPIPYDSSVHTIDADQYCNTRICQAPEELQGGMGDIFVLLSLVAGNLNSISVPQPPARFSCSEPMDNMEGDTHNTMVNIYGQPLESCRRPENSSDQSGSWDDQGYCSELGGGVHQICFDVNDSTVGFSSGTYQSDWSQGRINRNHCMCIGAWALYKARQEAGEIPNTVDELQCDAIPKVSLTNTYLNNWATWNGDELPRQIVQGVNKLVEQCYNIDGKTDEEKEHLRNLYIDLASNSGDFQNDILSFDQR